VFYLFNVATAVFLHPKLVMIQQQINTLRLSFLISSLNDFKLNWMSDYYCMTAAVWGQEDEQPMWFGVMVLSQSS